MGRRPLDGIRVLDLTRGWAGPLGTRILGDLGAQVIKIEALASRGVVRITPELKEKLARWRWGELPPPEVRAAIYPEAQPGAHPWLRQGTLNKLNRNKLSIGLDLTKPGAVAAFKRLVAVSDAVMENYTPRVMGNFGLDYAALRAVNPAIVLVSMPGFGLTGPYRDYAILGPNLEGASGLASLTGYEGGGPMKLGVAYSDPVGGLNGVVALLMALWQRRRTGRGQSIDVSQCEAVMCTMGEALLDYSMNGWQASPRGNGHPVYAPHGVYRCRGEDSWVAIAVRSDHEWQALGHALGDPGWARNDRFASAAGRREHHEEIDGLLESWTREREHQEVMNLLQAEGVPAGAAYTNKELLEDRHLRERGFWVNIDQPEVGLHPYDGLPMRFSETPADVWEPAPGLGQHNWMVMAELLGMSKNDVYALQAQGAIGDSPPGAGPQ